MARPGTPKAWDFVVGHSSPQAASPTAPPRTPQTIHEGSSTKYSVGGKHGGGGGVDSEVKCMLWPEEFSIPKDSSQQP